MVSSKADDDELNAGMNDQELDGYLRRESEVSQRYRELTSREVPPALEQRILHQAHTARTQRKSAAPRWLQWGAPLALAASALLTVSVLLRTTPEDLALQAPAPQANSPREDTGSTDESDAPMPQRSQVKSDALRDAAPVRELEAPPPAITPQLPSSDTAQPTQPAAPPAPAASRRDARTESSNEQAAGLRAKEAKAAEQTARAMTPAEVMQDSYQGAAAQIARDLPEQRQKRESPEPVSALQSAAPLPPPDAQLAADRKVAPQTLLKQVRELRAQGKTEEAAALFKRLRAAYPDFPVPERDQLQ